MTTVTNELFQEGRAEGREEGRKEGRLEVIINAVKHLKKESTKASAIKQITSLFGLTEDEALKYYDAA